MVQEFGWSMTQILTFGLVGGRGPDVNQQFGSKHVLYQAENAPAEKLLEMVPQTVEDLQASYDDLLSQMNKIITNANNTEVHLYIDQARAILGL